MSSTTLKFLAATVILSSLKPQAGIAQDDDRDSVGPSTGEAAEENAAAGLDVATIHEFRLLDRDGDRSLNRQEFGFSEIVQRALQADSRVPTNPIFQRIDKDGDGGIGLFELVQSQLNRNLRIMDRSTAKGFDQIDDNNDGLIGEQEFSASLAAGKVGATSGGQLEGGSEFGKIDLNGSGVIGPFEFLQAQANPKLRLTTLGIATRFARLDSDDNGAIKRSEYLSGRYSFHPRSSDREEVEKQFGKLDSNGNDEIGPREYANFQSALARKDIDKESLERFAKLDRNRDGLISRREYSRSEFAKMKGDRDLVDEVYAIIDANNDGGVGLSEFSKRFVSLGKSGRWSDGFSRREGSKDDDR